MKKHYRGQCLEKKIIQDTTFYCIEPAGHQCPHCYTVNMQDLERLLKASQDRLDVAVAALRNVSAHCQIASPRNVAAKESEYIAMKALHQIGADQ